MDNKLTPYDLSTSSLTFSENTRLFEALTSVENRDYERSEMENNPRICKLLLPDVSPG
jgi:hypothetical protein